MIAIPTVVAVGFWFSSVLYAWTATTAIILIWVSIVRDDEHLGPHEKLTETALFAGRRNVAGDSRQL